MEKLNVAVIGAGSMGKNHARIYSEMKDVSLVAVCDSNKDFAKEIADKYNAKPYSGYKEMLKNEKIDAVSICVPTKLHKEVALEVIKNKVHVLVEKPIATTTEEAKSIIDSAAKNKVKLMIGHIEIFNPVVQELKKRIEKNELGNILQVNCERLSLFPQRIIDVGVIVDLAIHEIYVLKYLIGSKVKRVYAETAQRFHSSNEDLVVGTIRFENGILGIVNANWLTPKKVRQIKVTGEKGMFVADYITQELYFYEKQFASKYSDFKSGFKMGTEGKNVKVDIKSSEPLRNELVEFISSIKDNKSPAVTGKDGLEALDIAQKFIESAKTGKSITIN